MPIATQPGLAEEPQDFRLPQTNGVAPPPALDPAVSPDAADSDWRISLQFRGHPIAQQLGATVAAFTIHSPTVSPSAMIGMMEQAPEAQPNIAPLAADPAEPTATLLAPLQEAQAAAQPWSRAIETTTFSTAAPFPIAQNDLKPNLQPSPQPTQAEPQVETDPELGNLRLQEIPVTAQSPPVQPTVYLLGRLDYFRSSNIFSGIDPVDDNLVRGGLSLWAAPALGPQTYLITSVSGNVIRYFSQSSFSYNELLFEASIYQQLSPQMSGEFGWANQHLFATESGIQFLDDHALRLSFNRIDPLSSQINFNTYYQLRYSFANPGDRSRLINYLAAALTYDIDPTLQAGLEYQLALTDFAQQRRNDTYNQIAARLTYRLTPESRLTLLGGFSFGASSNPNINFNGSIFSVNFSFNLPLF